MNTENTQQFLSPEKLKVAQELEARGKLPEDFKKPLQSSRALIEAGNRGILEEPSLISTYESYTGGKYQKPEQVVPEQDNSLFDSAVSVAKDINTGMAESFLVPDMLMDKFADYGLTRPSDRRIQSVGEGASRGLGQGLGFMAMTLNPYTAGGRLSYSGRTFLEKAAAEGVSTVEAAREGFRLASKSFGSAPVRFTGIEAGSAAVGAASGQAYREENPDDVLGAVFAELLGGMTTAVGLTVADQISGVFPVVAATKGVLRTAAKQAKKVIFQKDQTSKKRRKGIRRAKTRLASSLGGNTPEQAIAKYEQADVLEDAPLTVAERTEIPELLSLEKSIVESTEQLSQAQRRRFADINSIIRGEIDTTIVPEGQVVTPRQTRDYLAGLLNTRIETASAKMQEKIAKLGDKVSRKEANMLLKEELSSAYTAARQQEGDLWSLIPNNAFMSPASTKSTLIESLDNIKNNRALDQSDMSGYVLGKLGRYNKDGDFVPGEILKGGRIKVKELVAARSKILQEVANESAKDAPNRRKIGNLNKIQGAILDDLKAIKSDPNGNIEIARNFSYDVNERFTGGDVGKILGTRSDRTDKLDPSLTLEATLGTGTAPKRALSAERIISAISSFGRDNTAGMKYIKDFLADDFMTKAKTNGEYNQNAAENFLRTYDGVLGEFPDLKKDIEDYIQFGTEFKAANDLFSPNKSRAAVYLNANPDKEINRVLSSKEPGKTTEDILKQLRQDPEGKAEIGFRRAFVEYIDSQISKYDSLDVQDNPEISGTQLKKLFESESFKEVSDVLFTPNQKKRLEKIKNTAIRVERSKKAKPSPDGIINDRTGLFLNLVERVGFAQIGRWVASKTGGGTVQTPSAFIRVGQQLSDKGLDPSRKVVIDAMLDPDPSLFNDIMRDIKTPEDARQIVKRLDAWALETAREYGMSISSEGIEDEED